MLNKDFREWFGWLDAEGVEYLLVGGYAMAAHGRPRATGDIDVWVRPERANAERLIRALTRFGFGSLGLSVDDFLQPDAVVQLGYPPARIDLLTGIDGVEFAECFERRIAVEVDGVKLQVIHFDDLVANKRAAGRLQDRADLEALGVDDPAGPSHREGT